jgi:hypothetical protein
VRRARLAGIALLLVGCGGRDEEAAAGDVAEPASAEEAGIDSYDALVDTLAGLGFAIEPAGRVRQPFFSVEGWVVGVDGHEVEVFEYATEEEAVAQAALVSPDGGSVGPTMVHWITPPRFHRRGRLLVIFLGDDPAIDEALGSVLGPPFAGR